MAGIFTEATFYPAKKTTLTYCFILFFSKPLLVFHLLALFWLLFCCFKTIDSKKFEAMAAMYYCLRTLVYKGVHI